MGGKCGSIGELDGIWLDPGACLLSFRALEPQALNLYPAKTRFVTSENTDI